MKKYSNYFILFALLCIGVMFKDSIHISTNLLSLFASKDAREKLVIADKLGYSKELLVIVKGFDTSSKNKLREIVQKLQKVDGIVFVGSSLVPSMEVQNYYKVYYPILATFNDKNQTSKTIKESLEKLYDAQFTNVFYTAIDKNDPLSLFNLQNANSIDVSHRGEFIRLGDYGYLIRASTSVSASQMDKAKVLYKDVHSILDTYEDVTSFAPFYYTVENSTKIKEDVGLIIFLSTFILLIVYSILIRNIKLLFHTLIALLSSILFASLVTTMLFTNFNILSLAFGMSISAVSIDYLLHYYYHNFYQQDKKIDKSVLYGYITTVVAFGIFSFTPIPLISQISFFAVMSLSFAYLVFTFVFPSLSIDRYEEKKNTKVPKKIIPAYMFFLLSMIFFIYSSTNIVLNSNIKELDYQNKKLLELEKLITEQNNTKLTPVLVEASSKETLINKLHEIHKKLPNTLSLASFIPTKEACLDKKRLLAQYDFYKLNARINNEANVIGFKNGYFTESYNFTKDIFSCDIDNFDIFKSYNVSVTEVNNVYYTLALVRDINSTKEFSFVSSISAKDMFFKLANQMYKEILFYSCIVVLVIGMLLFLSVRRNFFYALNYILFPISLTLAILVSFTEINFMHIFSLIILLAIGIDYGIYMSNTNKPTNTILAIKYSVLSTFAAFGVLVFSSIVALNSIGIVISIGASAILILIKLMRFN